MASKIQKNPLPARPLGDVKLENVTAELGEQHALPGTERYAATQKLWNDMIRRDPAIAAWPSNEADVVKAVNFARARGLAVGAKGGGHNIAGKALLDGALIVDFARMKGVSIDLSRRRVRVQPGATLGDVDRATQRHGMIVPTGVNSTTGIAGLTLGGGFGWATRRFGLTIDSLRAARLVTAAGEALTLDDSQHTELYWAIRGGGGNFGVVTEFEFQLHDAGPQVLAGMFVHPLPALHAVLAEYQRILAGTPESLTCWVVLRKAPPLPFIPAEWHGRECVILAMCGLGCTLEEAAGAAEPFRRIGSPVAGMLGPMPFADWQAAFDPLLTPGARNYWKSHDVAAFSDAALDVIARAAAALPSDECEMFLAHLGGAMTRVPADATPWSNRAAHFIVNIHARWRDVRDDERCRRWARELHRELEPHAMGSVYVNFIPEGDAGAVRAAYGPNYPRLLDIKRRVDPGNLFRANQNIDPHSE